MASPPPPERQVDQNVVQRLQSRIGEARKMGFTVRMELLEDQQPWWCILAGTPTLFVDLSQTAAEQLRNLDEMVADYQRVAAPRRDDLPGNRAA